MTASPVNLLRGAEAAGAFDPLERFYVAPHAAPPALAPVSPGALTAFQRALLAIDGTVTQFIEAYMLEPVDVLRLDQQELRLAERDAWLDLDAGVVVIRRRVMLCGRDSGRFYAWADSVIDAAQIATPMRGALEQEGGGIGRMLIDAGVESRREALWYGRERPLEVPAPVAAHWPGEFLARSYRVLAGGRPMMLITERFPL